MNKIYNQAKTRDVEIIPPGALDRDKSMEYRIAKSEARLDLIYQQVRDIMTAIVNLRWWIAGSLLVGIGIIVACAAYQATWVQKYVDKSEETNKAFLNEMDKRWQAINAEQQKRFEIMMEAQGYRISNLEKAQD